MILKKSLPRILAACCLMYLVFGVQSLTIAQTIARASIKADHISSLTSKDIQPLTIGDEVPNIYIRNISNYISNKANTAAFKDKLLILDFMTTSCVSCIEALPKLNAIQKQFGENTQIFLVTYEKRERVKSFFQKNKVGRQVNLAFAAEDSILKEYFPHEYISHVVWIYKGRIKAITGTQYVKPENVETILKGEDVKWPVKRDAPEYDFTKPLLTPNESNFQTINIPSKLYYSSITSFIEGVGDNYKTLLDSAKQILSVRMFNSPITDLYLRSYGIFRFPLSHMVLEVNDRDRFIYNPAKDYRAAWEQQNCFCYDGSFPSHLSKEEIGKKIRNDLDFYFNLNGKLEKKLVNSYSLELTANANNAIIKTGKHQLSSDENPDSLLISISNIIYHLNETLYNKPVFDGTKLGQESYLKISRKALKNFDLLRAELNNYGLVLKEEEREVEMFVLTKR